LILETKKHITAEAKGVFTDNDQIVNVGKDPEETRIHSPENTWISYRHGESNGYKESTESPVPSKQSLLQAVDCFAELEEDILVGEITWGWKHQDFFLKVACEEFTLDVELVNGVALVDGMRDEETE
jgi:hypothetical protein